MGKFKAKNNPKDRFYPVDCRKPRERRVIEFLLPILYLEKPKLLSITMANTIFGALSGARPVNWGKAIQGLVEKSILHISRKPHLSLLTSSTSISKTDVSRSRKKMP